MMPVGFPDSMGVGALPDVLRSRVRCGRNRKLITGLGSGMRKESAAPVVGRLWLFALRLGGNDFMFGGDLHSLSATGEPLPAGQGG
jgi:hypothetical protein